MKLCVISPQCCIESATRLADLLGADYLPADRLDYSKYDGVVNYGSSKVGVFKKIINSPAAVKLCVNKISTLKRVKHGVQWTKEPEKALAWLREGHLVVSRATEA